MEAADILGLQKPSIITDDNYVILSNNAISQLNVMKTGENTSLFEILNECSTPMGAGRYVIVYCILLSPFPK